MKATELAIRSNILPEIVIDISGGTATPDTLSNIIQPEVTYFDPLKNSFITYAPYGKPQPWGVYVIPAMFILLAILYIRK
jgi:hypothetical protein